MSTTRSGDLCHLGPNHVVTHRFCDDYADGTQTDARNGAILKRANRGARRGFNRIQTAVLQVPVVP